MFQTVNLSFAVEKTKDVNLDDLHTYLDIRSAVNEFLAKLFPNQVLYNIQLTINGQEKFSGFKREVSIERKIKNEEKRNQ